MATQGLSQNAQKYILLAAMIVNGIITPGGIIYGWPGLSQELKDEGQYTGGCDTFGPHITCPSQDNALANIYTVGANIATVATIAYGFSIDRFGVRSNAVSGALLMAVGFLLLAFSQSGSVPGKGSFDGFMVGFALVAWGGLGTYLPAFQFAALFERPGRWISMQSAMYGVAGLTFTFFKYLYESHGVTRETGFIIYAGLCGFCAINMALLYPANSYRAGDLIHLPVLGWLGINKPPRNQHLDEAIVNGEADVHGDTSNYSPLREDEESLAAGGGVGTSAQPRKLSLGHQSAQASAKMEVLSHDGLDERGANTSASPLSAERTETSGLLHTDIAQLKAIRFARELTPLEREQLRNGRTLKEEILDPGTLWVSLHFSIGLLCCNLYNANVATVLEDMGDNNDQFINAFIYISSIYPILFNLSIDELQRKYRYAGTSFLATTGLIIGIAFLFINNLYAQLPGFVFFSTGRALLITVMFSFVALEYRGEHYGRVIAFVTTICAAIGLLQLALQKILTGPADNDFNYFVAGMVIALAPLYGFSYWCYKNRT